MHDLVCRKALHTGLTFAQQLNNLIGKKEISRTSARSVSFADPDVRAEELQRGYVAMESYSMNDYKFKKELSKRMGLKNSSKIDKEIGKLKLDSTTQLVTGLLGELSRLENRYYLENLNCLELIGRKFDQSELLKYIKIDCCEFGNCEELKDLIKSVAARMLDPHKDLSTCKAKNATLVAKENNLEDKKEIEKLVNDDVNEIDLAPMPGTGVKLRDGKMYFELNDSFNVILVLDTPLTDLYLRRRYLLSNVVSNKCLLDIFRSGKVPHLDATGNYCLMYNYPHAEWSYKCTDPNCEKKKLCINCSGKHPQTECNMLQGIMSPTAFKVDWLSRPVTRGLVKIHEASFAGNGRYGNFRNGPRTGRNSHSRGPRNWRENYGSWNDDYVVKNMNKGNLSGNKRKRVVGSGVRLPPPTTRRNNNNNNNF